jgi:hypothetical protein
MFKALCYKFPKDIVLLILFVFSDIPIRPKMVRLNFMSVLTSLRKIRVHAELVLKVTRMI